MKRKSILIELTGRYLSADEANAIRADSAKQRRRSWSRRSKCWD